MNFSEITFKNIKRTLLTIIVVITIVPSSSIVRPQNAKFGSNVFNPFNFETKKEEGFSETLSRVKRQTLPQCKPDLTCNDPTINRFRTFDGTCNNLQLPFCGASEIPFDRWLDRSPSGHDLRCPLCPRPRDVSTTLTSILPGNQNDGITLMVMQWGQFTDHDLLFTREDTDNECCQDFQTPTGSTDSCIAIDVTGDAFYQSLSTTVNCLPFVRSTAATCQVGSDPAGADRQNINERTAYLDGSVIYGSTKTVADSLRTFNGGLLKISSGSESLPCSGADNVCPRTFLPERGIPPTFFAGDTRPQEQPALTSLHTLFLRLHNFLAELFNCAPNGGLGSDEVTYQVTRKIVGALVQQITYSEYLPIILGQEFMFNFGLHTYNGYDPSICVIAPSVFVSAAYRFGHSLIPNEFETIHGPILLERVFNNHDVTLNPNSHPSHFLHAIITQPAMPMDHILEQSVTNKLFARGPNFEFGSDLFSRNVKRGRDHGIAGYIHWFNVCVNNDPSLVIRSFDDLYNRNVIPVAVVDALRILYNDRVEDIDLFPAGIAEFPVSGGLVGPTFACIIARYFVNLKDGDRFWYETDGYFTSQQIQSIHRTSLASLICAFTFVEESRYDVMLLSSPIDDCSIILEDGLLNDVLFTSIWSNICFE